MPAINVSGWEAFCFADINLHLSAAIINADVQAVLITSRKSDTALVSVTISL